MKIKLLFILLLISLKSFSQNDRKVFYGKLYDAIGILPNVHIINNTTKSATYSDYNGEFKIPVKIGDSLKITSVGYTTLTFKIAEKHLGITINNFEMTKEVIELDEIEIKKHNLTGSLALDFQQIPKDRKADALANNMDFSKINMKAKMSDDFIDKHVRPPIVKTDPIAPGVGGSIPVPFGHSQKLWKLRKKLAFKESMPAKLLNELGEDFFFKSLKIPVENYHHFLNYCNPLGIEKLYQERKVLEVIKILREEHLEYLKIIKNE